MVTLPLEEQIEEIRAEFPAVLATGYLNTGTIAPLPLSVLRRHQAREVNYHTGGPLNRDIQESLRSDVAAVRGKLAAFLDVPTERIALAENTTAGMNLALLSQTWEDGDEVLTSDAEHPAVLLPLAYIERKFGVVVRKVPGLGASSDAQRIRSELSARTKAIVISHVSYSTGAALDLPAICQLGREHGIVTVVDGAQSAGAMVVSLAHADPDYYAFPGYKWLLGPQGTAGLYASPRVMTDQHVPYRIGSHAVARRPESGGFDLHVDARRFEGTATTAALDIVTLGDSADWLARYGMPSVAGRIAGLCSAFKEGLMCLDSAVELITPHPACHSAGLVAFRPRRGPAASVIADRLYDQGLIIRTVSGDALRAAFHLYNTMGEVERLLAALGDLLAPGA